MKRVLIAAIAGLVVISSACSSQSKVQTTATLPSPSIPSPSPQANESPAPNSDIGKTDAMGTVVMVDLPKDEACHRNEQSVKMDTFEKCLVNDLTYVQVANTLGYRGKLMVQAGNNATYQWNGGTGKYITATFINGKMVAKSQVGLY